MRNGYWFQQDGAPCHTANQTFQFLQRKFPGRLMSKRGDIEWPPISSDWAPSYFFLWGYLKIKAAKRAHFALANKGDHLIDGVFKN